jgi:hypothetical protein
MTATGTEDGWLGGALRLTWVTDHLAHVLEHCEAGEASGTWAGLTCPRHGLPIGGDAGNATLLRLAGQDQIADLVWKAPEAFTAEHGQFGVAALQAHLSGRLEEGERLWEQVAALWSHAWATNYQVLELLQGSGLTRLSPARPQRWVVASFEHHASAHGHSHPHIHNIAIPALTTAAPG